MRGTLILGAVMSRVDHEYIDTMRSDYNTSMRWMRADFAREWVRSYDAAMHLAAVSTGMRYTPRPALRGLFE